MILGPGPESEKYIGWKMHDDPLVILDLNPEERIWHLLAKLQEN